MNLLCGTCGKVHRFPSELAQCIKDHGGEHDYSAKISVRNFKSIRNFDSDKIIYLNEYRVSELARHILEQE